jgi:hypothetical protein
VFHGIGSEISPKIFTVHYHIWFLSVCLSLLTGDYQERNKKLGIYLTVALKLVILIGIFLSIAESLKPKLQIPNCFCSSM